MDRISLNYIVDIGLFVTFFITLATGILKFPELTRYFVDVYLVVPAGVVTRVHDMSAILMSALIFIHIALHRKQIAAMTGRMFSGKGR